MDENCRKDLPSPKGRTSASRDEPKSPPKSVRFTDEDAEVIDQSSTEKRKKERKSIDSSLGGNKGRRRPSLKHSSASHESGEGSALRSSSRSAEE